MFLLGYHGTSEYAAAKLIAEGPKVSGAYAAIGAGLYIAREPGDLVDFFSNLAMRRDVIHNKELKERGPLKELLSKLENGKCVLKIYSILPLHHLPNCRWDIMDVSKRDINICDSMNNYKELAAALQMVIPPEYFKYIRAKRLTTLNLDERPIAWPAKTQDRSQSSHPKNRKFMI